MAPTKKAPPAEVEPKGEEQEPTTDPDEASPPEGETQEQRGDGTPDPLAGLTTEQLREHPLFQEASADLTATQKEEREKAYREGQSAGAKQADEDARQWAAQQEAIKTFENLEGKRVAGEAGDPDAANEYARAMGDPKVRDAHERGRSAKQGPGAEEIATSAVNEAMTEAWKPLKEHPFLKEMTDKDHLAIYEEFKGQDQPYMRFLRKYCELIVEHGSAAGRIAEGAKQLSDAKEDGREAAYNEMGLNYPGPEIEGGTAPSGKKLPTKDELGKLSVEELTELEKKGKLDQILAGHK